MRTLSNLTRTLVGIGCIGFGGGSALIPVFQERLVETGKVKGSDFDDDMAVACITPGALPVEISAGLGMRTAGARGALAAAAAIALPGAVLLVLVMALLSQSAEGVITQVRYLAVGVSAYIISVVARYVKGSVEKGGTRRNKGISLLVVALVFALTCEKNLYKIVGLQGVDPLFALGTVNVMALTFFVALWIRGRRSPGAVSGAVVLAGAYVLLGTHFLDVALPFGGLSLEGLFAVVLVVLALASLRADAKGNGVKLNCGSPKTTLAVVGLSLVTAGVCLVPAFVLLGADTLFFAGQGALSSVLSFGGGDAYIAMADGMFVESGMLSEDVFYSTLVPVVNALPGSILCKMLAGMGYCIGSEAAGSVAAGLALAFGGFAVAVAMSCITYAMGHYFYEALEGLDSFALIKRFIGCVISGLLLTVALGLLNTCAKAAPEGGVQSGVLVFLCLVLVVANAAAKSRWNAHPLVCVVASALVGCVAGNLMALL